MTDQEIDRIECAIRHIQTAVDVDLWARKIAVEAMERQIPKKLMKSIDVTNENLWHLYCPTCGSWVGMHNKRLKGTDMHNNTNCEICAKCGQVFDLEMEDNFITREAVDMAISALQVQIEQSKKQKQPESLLKDHCCEFKEQTDKLEDGDKLDEAIRDFERDAQNDEDNFHLTGAKCFNGCAEYEWQIVRWLRELKERREQERV